MDADELKEDTIGSVYLSAKEIVNNYSEGGYLWANIYGGPATTSNEFTEHMNENPEVASDWQGRLLLYLKAEDNKHPDLSVTNMDKGHKNIIEEAKPFLR